MSSMFPEFLPRSSRAAYERQVWAEFFGDLIRSDREERTLSFEEEQLKAVAGALAIEWDGMVSLILCCREAWPRLPRRPGPFPGPPHS